MHLAVGQLDRIVYIVQILLRIVGNGLHCPDNAVHIRVQFLCRTLTLQRQNLLRTPVPDVFYGKNTDQPNDQHTDNDCKHRRYRNSITNGMHWQASPFIMALHRKHTIESKQRQGRTHLIPCQNFFAGFSNQAAPVKVFRDIQHGR